MIDVKREVKTEFQGYFRVPMDEFTEMSRDGVTAIYLYSPNVLSCGEVLRFDESDRSVRTQIRNGIAVAPVSLFTRFLGVKRVGNTLIIGEKSVEIGESSANASVAENGVELVPVIAISRALGLNLGVYHDERLFVFAKQELLDKLNEDRLLMRGACYAVFGNYSTDHLTHEDFVAVKNKWRRVLVGSPEINDRKDPDAAGKLDEIDKACENALAIMNRDPNAVILFGTEPPTESNDLRVQYEALLCLARAYGTYGCRYYKNESLKNDILFGFEWMYVNMYGESIIEGRGWRDPHLFNWWEWMTGAIDPMTDALMIMEEHLDIETIRKYLRCYDYVSTFHRTLYREDHASTRLKVGTKVAVLLEDRERLYYRFLDYDLQFEPIGPQKGKYSDHVCWTHGFPYNMMYGLIYMNRTLFVGSMLIGTPMEYSTPDFYDFFLTAKYMYDAAMYRGRGFAVFRGRGFGGEKDSGSNVLNGILPMLGAYGEEEDRFIKKMVKLGCADPQIRKMLISRASLNDLALIKSIIADESISDENDKEMAHSWFTADRFAQHRNDYAFMLAMSSVRHMSYESINSAHKTGWYTGDGALYLYTNADSKSFENSAFQSNINVCYRMPGVTADTRERAVWSHRHGWKPSNAYSGSMDFLGKFGVAAFDYEPYHYEGHEAEGTTDEGYGGAHVYHENDLRAKKSYHFFDKECVCLGAGIKSTMNSPVKTTVEHRRLVEGGEAVTVGGEKMSGNFEQTSDALTYVTLEGVAGYVFPTGGRVRASVYRHDPKDAITDHYAADETRAIENYFELGIEHGANPTGAKYEYIILPLSDEKSTRVYANAPEVEIIENSERLQAVRKPSLGITSAALFEAGKIGPVEASEPCILMYRETDGLFELSVSDPTQKLESAVFMVDGEYTVVSLDVELSAEVKDGATVITANLERLAGKALRTVLKKQTHNALRGL